MKRRNIIILLIEAFFIGIILFSLLSIFKWSNEKKISNKEIHDIKEVVINKKKDINFKELKRINKDVVGWIKVPNTSIDYPVVKTSNNDYYLNHSFRRKDSNAGWIFMDYRNRLDGSDNNIVMYGHNRLDGIMFGHLKKLLNKYWFNNKDNLYIEFITDKDKSIYKIFSIYEVKDDTYYLKTKVGSYDKFINKLKSRSIYNFNTELVGENIITLSTCTINNDYRLVVHAIKAEKK